jgi:hypothetical protein
MPARPASALVLTGLLVAGCASRPAGAPPITPEAANGQAIVTVLATPFHALFKATGCVLSTVIAVPTTAGLALTDRPRRGEEQLATEEGLGRNCYGSYVYQPR